MKKISIVFVLVIFVLQFTASAQAGGGFYSWLFSVDRKNEVEPVTDELYIEECGSCHFAYQPGLLPEDSWRKLIAAESLEDHFGDNAELDEDTRLHILDILVNNSADKSFFKRSYKIMVSLGKGDAPLRIIDVPYIRRKHHEIPDKLVKGNERVKSLSYCDKCHKKAHQSVYDDDSVEIPGYGKWTW